MDRSPQKPPADTQQRPDPDESLRRALRRVQTISKPVYDPPAAAHSTLLEKRYELKYRISEATAVAIRSYVRSHLPLDKYASCHPSGQYPVCTLYLDSPRFDLFYETILDKCNRYKLRVRGYDDDPNSPVFFEIKRKFNRIIYKSRGQVGKDRMSPILSGGPVPYDLPEEDRKTLKQFTHYCHCLCARPVVMVRYLREAYETPTESRVRITFDRQLVSRAVDRPVFSMNGQGWRPVPINFVVLELKFTDRYPLWLNSLVRLFDLDRQSMSKYCSSVRPFVQGGAIYYSIPKR